MIAAVMVGRRVIFFLHGGGEGLENVIGGTLSSGMSMFAREVAIRKVVYHPVVPDA